ncbi:MAG TPA: PRC-barrel domain-containing protein [Candidatus Baltobacteraceae bacterium]|nr:PRC-barrel domain-containing protein [Candidatus Baltobacteraceae bacterium]
MATLLEEVTPGTPVVDRTGESLGEVRAVYGSGEGRLAEFVLVFWTARGAEALVPADDVESVSGGRVTLMGSAASYESLAAFDPSANPQLHRL